jgi:predicted RNA-binding Zn-ribbon protein involved in translation (DUF1610 family)
VIVSADLHPETRSRPLYRPPAPDPTARAHLIVTDGRALPAEARTAFAGTMAEVWTRPDPLPALAARLATETIGLRLIVIGPEAFLWDAARVAAASGLGADEMSLHPAGPPTRRVRCVHCRTIIEDVATRAFDCPGCALPLLARDHFSRRLGAFQGIARHGATRGESPGDGG